MKDHESCFSITLLNDSELDPLYARMQLLSEAAAHTTPPRSQKIVQCCNLHKAETDNIFILVDTSVEHISDRLSDPQSGLFAPGTTLPRYPDGFKTKLGFREIPYEELLPRCVHSFFHSQACEECFPHGHDEDNCAECVEHLFPVLVRHRNWVLIDAAIEQEREARNENAQVMGNGAAASARVADEPMAHLPFDLLSTIEYATTLPRTTLIWKPHSLRNWDTRFWLLLLACPLFLSMSTSTTATRRLGMAPLAWRMRISSKLI